MMPVVRINDATFGDLKSISTWLGTATPAQTIDEIVRQAMEKLGLERDMEADPATTTANGVMQFGQAPGLAFTKPLSASVDGKKIRNPRWSAILLTMIGEIRAKGFRGDALVRELHIPAKAEQYEEEGFKYHPDLEISVQGQSASDAWKEIERIANTRRIPVTVEFWWRQNPKAQYPGQLGSLRAG